MTIVVASLVKTAEKDNIIQHTNSYHPSVSQYTQKNVPNHRYINPDLTVSDMHRESYNSSSIERFLINRILSFASVDECPICLSTKDHTKETLMDELHDTQIYENCHAHKKYVELREE